MNTLVLRLDVTGRPLDWISREQAALIYCRESVAWEAGESVLRMYGGHCRATGKQSYLDINTIIASTGMSRKAAKFADVPALTNARLFRRDRFMCLYCGNEYSVKHLTRDHVVPLSRGGRDEWANVVTACRRCNQRKDDRTPEEAERIGMRLLAVPYRPNNAEGLILANRKILDDQMAFLSARIGRDSRLMLTN